MRNLSICATAILIAILAASSPVRAQCQRGRIIVASGAGLVIARPDLGIIVMQIQSSAPLAADAAGENQREARDVRSSLKSLGFGASDYELTPVVFTRAGGQYYGPNQPRISGFKAEQFVYVFFTGSALEIPAEMSRKVGAVIDALAKAGAVVVNPYPNQQSAMVVYTVRHPSPYEEKALAQALGKAHRSVQLMAGNLGIELGSLCTVMTGYVGGWPVGGPGRVVEPYPQSPTNALAELPYHFYSTREDQVEISVSVRLTYSFK